jgi:hypothetical protein
VPAAQTGVGEVPIVVMGELVPAWQRDGVVEVIVVDPDPPPENCAIAGPATNIIAIKIRNISNPHNSNTRSPYRALGSLHYHAATVT